MRDEPFDVRSFEVWPANILDEVEAERISLLPEFADILASDRLLMQAREHFVGDDMWPAVVNFTALRNELRRLLLPAGAAEESDDRRYAAEFFHAPDPENASWDAIHDAARARDHYMRQLGQLLGPEPLQ